MNPIEEVTVQELQSLLDERPDTFVLDVRRPDEYIAGHATIVKLLIEHTAIGQHLGQLPADPDTPIYVICRSGKRSAFACEVLDCQGYRNVYNVAGGTKAWRDAGLPMETGDGILAEIDD